MLKSSTKLPLFKSRAQALFTDTGIGTSARQLGVNIRYNLTLRRKNITDQRILVVDLAAPKATTLRYLFMILLGHARRLLCLLVCRYINSISICIRQVRCRILYTSIFYNLFCIALDAIRGGKFLLFSFGYL